jgi:hypothetical protein
MKFIAHRGLMDGPDDNMQNRPDQIVKALDHGFEAEIDVWHVDGKWVLGHDGPEHDTDIGFLQQKGLWIHCKNLDALFTLRSLKHHYNFFWHESDTVTLTSTNVIWTYFGKPETVSPMSVCVMPEVTYGWDEIENMVRSWHWYGFCSDHVNRLRAWQH